VLVEALAQIRQKLPSPPQIVVAVAPGLDVPQLEARFPSDWRVRLIKDDAYDALAASDLAIVSSGTATVETALLGKPMIVVYRLSPLTARLAKPLVRTKFFSMVNLIAGRAVVPELIQHDFTPQRVAEEAEKLLSATEEGKNRVEAMNRGLEEVRRLLGPPGAVERAADEIAKLLNAAQSNAK
jgi:lipid-A-disaccharide synthase